MIYNPPPTTPQPYQPLPYAPQAPVAPQAPAGTQAEQTTKSGWTRYTIIFGVIVTGVTALALILAALAPSFSNAGGATVPTNWTTQYHGDLVAPTGADSAAWKTNSSCSFYSGGLDAGSDSADSVCDFSLAGSGGQTNSGFYLEVTVAPPADVPTAYEESLIQIGDLSQANDNSLAVLVEQSGNYYVCTTATCSAGQGAAYQVGITSAWHGGGYVANTIGVLVSADHQTETLFINHQRVASVNIALGATPAIEIGAPKGTESLYTTATFSTGQ